MRIEQRSGGNSSLPRRVRSWWRIARLGGVTRGRPITRRRCITRPWCGIWRGRRPPRGHALRIIGVVLLLQVPSRILRVGCTNSGAEDRPGGRPDPGASTDLPHASSDRFVCLNRPLLASDAFAGNHLGSKVHLKVVRRKLQRAGSIKYILRLWNAFLSPNGLQRSAVQPSVAGVVEDRLHSVSHASLFSSSDSAFFARGGSAGMDTVPAHQARRTRRRKAISGCTRSNSTARRAARKARSRARFGPEGRFRSRVRPSAGTNVAPLLAETSLPVFNGQPDVKPRDGSSRRSPRHRSRHIRYQFR